MLKITLEPLKTSALFRPYVVRDNGHVIYVGYGRITDILSAKELLANPHFNANKSYQLDVLDGYEHAYQAANVQSQLIRTLCPAGIPPMNLTSNRFGRSLPVRCDQTGIVYRNASKACSALDIPAGRMSNHLARKPGHKSIKGLSFSYAAEYRPNGA